MYYTYMLDERFWSKVDRTDCADDCWVWNAKTSHNGYGVFWLNGKNRRAHRVVLEDVIGPPPSSDSLALHSCDNPPCVNPKHLRWGTVQDNTDDRLERWGSGEGANNPNAVLTEDNVKTIYAMRMNRIGHREIAKTLGLPPAAVEKAYTGSSWCHLLGVNGNPTLDEMRSVKSRRTIPPHNKILTDKIADQILRMRMDGMNSPEIANQLGMPIGTIVGIYSGLEFTHRHGVDGNPTLEELRATRAPHPTQKLFDEDVEEIRALLKEGYTGRSIAKKYGIAPSLVSHIKNGKR